MDRIEYYGYSDTGSTPVGNTINIYLGAGIGRQDGFRPHCIKA